jgi:hypothetical protein
MNSDLVYKKKYLKYKDKYTALQRQLNVQEGGAGWSSFKALNPYSSVTLKDTKSGIYLFLVDNEIRYNALLDPLGLIQGKFLSDSNVEITRALGPTCYYVERKIKFTAGTLGWNDTPEIKRCGQTTNSTGKKINFTTDINNVEGVMQIAAAIKQMIHELTHFFIVDYSNTTSSNRISCLYTIPPPQQQYPPQQLQQYPPQQQQYPQQQYPQQLQLQQYVPSPTAPPLNISGT